MLQGLIQHIQKEWSVLKGAPLAFVILLVGACAFGYFVNGLLLNAQIQNLQSAVTNANAATAAANADLQRLRDASNQSAAPKQVPPDQIAKIEQVLQKRPSSVEWYSNPTSEVGLTIGDQMKSAFNDSGWTVATEGGMLAIAGPDVAATLRVAKGKDTDAVAAALDAAKVNYTTSPWPNMPDSSAIVVKIAPSWVSGIQK